MTPPKANRRFSLIAVFGEPLLIAFRHATAALRHRCSMAETVDTKPVFREAFSTRRCLVSVEAFYEWKKLGPKEKQPYAIALAGGGFMALAGLAT
jgi:putative SOS response-associated peptidase YedK